MSIIAYPLEATEYTAEDVQSYLSTRTSGVYSEDITFTPEEMTVTVSPFLAWFNYAKFKGCSVAVTEPETLTFSPAHAVLDRIDRVVLRLDFTLNRAYFTIIEGTPSSSPVPSDISKTEAINDISPVHIKIRAGATEITPADITSTILDENVCGIMRDGVTGIPTAQLQSQVEELLDRLQNAIDEVQSGSAFMIGDIYDPNQKNKPIAFDDEVLKRDGSASTTSDTFYFSNELAYIFANLNMSKFASYTEDQKKYRAFVLFNQDYESNVENSFLVQDKTDVNSKSYKIFGEHNKPTGQYKGNGVARTISTGGIGKVIYIYESNYSFQGIITGGNGFCWEVYSDGTVQFLDPQMGFYNGELDVQNSSVDYLNETGKTYYYQVL